MRAILNGNDPPDDFLKNRAFSYGDGLFETMRFWDGRILNLGAHLNRLSLGIRVLKLEHPNRFMREWQDHAESLGKESGNNARLRLTVFRGGEGFYLPQSNSLEWLLEAFPMKDHPYENPGAFETTIARTARRPLWNLSSFKMLSCIPAVLASMEARDKGFDELIMLNFNGRVSEGIRSNVFLVMDGTVHTPLAGEGQVEGTMKQAVTAVCQMHGIPIKSRVIPEKDLETAQEIWFSNALQGLQYASSIDGRILDHSTFTRVRTKLIEELLTKA